jgi:hypothetical protein
VSDVFHQFLAHEGDVYILDEIINTIKKNTEALLEAGAEVGLRGSSRLLSKNLKLKYKVKVNLSLRLIKRHAMKAYWAGDIELRILNLGTRRK